MVRRHTALPRGANRALNFFPTQRSTRATAASGRRHESEMPVAMAVAGALCAALLGFGCLKAVRLVSQIRAYKEGTKAINVTTPADFLALQVTHTTHTPPVT